MNNMLEAKAQGGGKVYLNISEDTCMRFGFKYGQRIIDPHYDKGVVMGVAPAEPGASDVLWFAFDCDEGEIRYWDEHVDLVQEGFKRIDLTTEEVLNETVVCFRVTATTNGKAESVIVRDVVVAAAQGKVFLRAGHKEFMTNPVMVLFDKSGDRGDVFGDKFIETAEVHGAPIPSRYSRADLYPGITVKAYDRDVLKRRVTWVQVVVVMLVALVIMAAGMGMAAALVIVLSRFFDPLFASLGLFVAVSILLLSKKDQTLIMACGMWVAGIQEGD